MKMLHLNDLSIQNLDIGGDENILHLSDHTPVISFGYTDNAIKYRSRTKCKFLQNPIFLLQIFGIQVR